MKRQHIDIQGMNIHTGPWIHTVPATSFKFIEANKVTFAVTERNYYLDTKKDKIRSQFMACDNCSWNHSYAIYMEVYPGIFAYCIGATEDNLTMYLEQYSKIYKDNDYPNNPAIDKWRKELVRK